MLKIFGDEGEIIARRIGLGAIPNASTMSRMLKDNFKVDYQVEIGDTIKHRQYGSGKVTEKFKTPQGEMLWIDFFSGRRKKVLSKDIAVINIDTETYLTDEVELYEFPEADPFVSEDDLEYNSDDNLFDF